MSWASRTISKVVDSFDHDYTKAKNKFNEHECESSLRYILGKSRSNKEENKAIDRIKNSDQKVGEILNRHSPQFNDKECVFAMKMGLAHEGFSKSNIDDIMIQVAGKTIFSMESDSL